MQLFYIRLSEKGSNKGTFSWDLMNKEVSQVNRSCKGPNGISSLTEDRNNIKMMVLESSKKGIYFLKMLHVLT